MTPKMGQLYKWSLRKTNYSIDQVSWNKFWHLFSKLIAMKNIIKIFILDDDRYYGHFLKNSLKNDKYDIRYFQNENECLNCLTENPDILILDHILEYTTGLEVLDEVQRQSQRKINVIYLSAQEHVHIAIKAMAEGAITYIEKTGNATETINQAIENIIKLTKNFTVNLKLQEFRKQHL